MVVKLHSRPSPPLIGALKSAYGDTVYNRPTMAYNAPNPPQGLFHLQSRGVAPMGRSVGIRGLYGPLDTAADARALYHFTL